MKYSKLIIALSSATMLPLTSCTNRSMSHEVNQSYAHTQATIKQQLSNPKANQRFVVNKGRFVDTTMHVLNPAWYNKPVEMHAAGVSLVTAMNILTQNTGIKIIYSDHLKDVKIDINFTGTLYNALNHIMHKNNIYFAIEGSKQNSLRWSSTELKTFDIAFMPGETSFSVGGDSNTSGKSGNSASLKGNVSVWTDIQKTVQTMLSPEGKLNISQSTSTVTVSDRPLVIERIAKFIKQYNKTLSLRVVLHMKILEVQLNKQHQFGIDWNLVYKGMSLGGMTGNAATTVAGFAANAASQSGNSGVTTSTSNMQWSGTSTFINALDGQGKTSVIDEPTVTTLNNSPSTISITDKKAYIKSTDVTSTGSGSDATTQYSINPDEIITGLKMTLIPHIQGNKVYLSIDGSLSNLQSIETKTFGEKGKNQYEIQLPDVSSKDFNQRVMAFNKHLIVLSGLRTKNNTSQNSKNFKLSLLGSNSDQLSQKELVVLIEPEIIND